MLTGRRTTNQNNARREQQRRSCGSAVNFHGSFRMGLLRMFPLTLESLAEVNGKRLDLDCIKERARYCLVELNVSS
jgi:hypothetical protein